MQIKKISVLFFLALACKTPEGRETTVKAENPYATQAMSADDKVADNFTPDFCNSENIRFVQQLRDLDKRNPKGNNFAVWRKLFGEGRANESLRPTYDTRSQNVLGDGYPKIFNAKALNGFANYIWNGKEFSTTPDGSSTTLVNRFVKESGNDVKLFTADVVIDAKSQLADADTQPVILLDYRNSQFVDPNTHSVLVTPPGGVPVIRAVRDEIRLVCQTTERGERRRLYLGPTFLLPGQFYSLVGKKIGVPFEKNPILWFALEFKEQMGSMQSDGKP